MRVIQGVHSGTEYSSFLWLIARRVLPLLWIIEVVTMLKSVRLFGANVPVKDRDCTGMKVEPFVNFFVRMTDLCCANCAFCKYHSEKSQVFDMKKFKMAFDEIRSVMWVNKLALTGGEPTLCLDDVFAIVDYVHKSDPEIPITINTNGRYLKNLDKKRFLDKIYDIALSVHHYDEERNSAIFRSDEGHASIQDVRKFVGKNKLHIRCNLIKGQIDNSIEVAKFLKFFADMGIQDFGFVSMMLVNKFCKDHFISYKESGLESQPSTRLTRKLAWRECSCKNFLGYTDQGRLYRYYTRTDTNNPNDKIANKLVFDVAHLKLGFNGEVII